MTTFSDFLSCCCIRSDQSSRLSEKHLSINPGHYATYQDHPSKAELADQIVAKLLAADKNDAILKADLQSTIHTYGWYDGLAAAVLAALENAIKLGEEMGPAMKSAYEKAVAGVNMVEEWAAEHPEMVAVLVTIIALGVLAIMTPWLMAWLGFAEEGIVEGSWAAGWQATYRGFVPKGSLFSYLQSLGTKIGRNWYG
ncbi:hypothetical protein K432DRAFT_364519 [Lepidopterella palustris CBS 459.81]|uniref:Uncharacterized protein n=1 Tax=Lepidopterella palustris CBS 459.81 TaxID=1314670 RepID=A0A8E2DY77_9PEZI|nr:hypothetical protein K432DRAFT_364519 [Lepidopterella palustris CBS 459.81]